MTIIVDDSPAAARPTRTRAQAAAWWTVAVASLAIAGYALSYIVLREVMYPDQLAASFSARPWGILAHVFFGGAGLLLGPLQFHPRVQARRAVHRAIGKMYLVSALGIGAAGLYMAVYSYGGMVTHLGFGALATALVVCTLTAYSHVRRGEYRRHRAWMIRSFALIFAAVTLRLELPLLMAAYGGRFDPAYLWVSWICWVPNLIAADWYIRRTRDRPLRFAGALLEREVLR
jgi:hypothetical protein